MSAPSVLTLSQVKAHAESPEALAKLLTSCHTRAQSEQAEAWIHRPSLDAILQSLHRATERKLAGESLPLYGVPFGVKDNIDVAGTPTTAACPAFSYVPTASSPVVERLIDAGAVFMGKTNLDQFATGLSGVRSPYGVCRNAFDPGYISGGSSSGSGVAVAQGTVCFALGTDTAGSGRVPAALNDIVGVKPTRGLLSTRGVVPACRSLDCVTLFAANAGDALPLLELCKGYDSRDPFSRLAPVESAITTPGPLRLGVPRDEQLETFGDADAARLFTEAVQRFAELGARVTRVDLAPFLQAARLLYEGPWVAERLEAAGPLLAENPDALHPVVRSIVAQGLGHTALDAFRGQYELARLRRASEAEWQHMELMLLPTTPTTYRIAELEADPIELNSRLGYYTNFVNLFDLAALALPAGFRSDGLPLGVTLIGPAFSDRTLLGWGQRFATP